MKDAWSLILDDLARQDMRSIMWGCPPGCEQSHSRPHNDRPPVEPVS